MDVKEEVSLELYFYSKLNCLLKVQLGNFLRLLSPICNHWKFVGYNSVLVILNDR